MSTDAGRIELPAGVRVIRRLAPPDAPWPASLVRTDDGATGMLVDSAALTGWEGWDAAPGGHVLGPLDVLRRADGHDVLLPLCTERIDALLSRRGGSLALTPGETVTVAVSVLRGMAELAGRGPNGADGSWWLTADGRPVFVDEPGGPPAAATTADLLDRLAADTSATLAAVLGDAAALVREPRALTRESGDIEDRLFEVAPAEPLATAPLASSRLGQAGAREDGTDDENANRSWLTTLLASADTDLADAISRATTGLWRRMRRPARTGRRRPWVLAGCLGAGVLAAGLFWPAPGGPATADVDGAAPSASVEPDPAAGEAAAAGSTDPAGSQPPAGPNAAGPDATGPEPAGPDAGAPVEASGTAPEPGASPSAGSPADLVAVTTSLLERRGECLAAGGGACLSELMEDPSRAVPPGPVDADPGGRIVTLLDEFGGVAVLRAEATASASAAQLIVITRRDGQWLLRDVHDVAVQP